MNSLRALTLAAVTAGAAVEAAQYGHVVEPIFAPAMAPRDNHCPELPKLCTDHAMLHGVATTLTYLCADQTQNPTTVHVTVTETTTVTAAPTSGVPAVPAPTKDTAAPEEPTSTTTVKSTRTQYKTVTVSRVGASSQPALTSPVITDHFSAVSPAPITPNPPVITDKVSTTSSSGALTPPHITWSFTEGIPTVIGGTGHSRPTAWTDNGTISSSYAQSSGNSSTVAPTPIYPNMTSNSAYATPNVYLARQLQTPSLTGVADQGGVSCVALVLGLMAAAFVV